MACLFLEKALTKYPTTCRLKRLDISKTITAITLLQIFPPSHLLLPTACHLSITTSAWGPRLDRVPIEQVDWGTRLSLTGLAGEPRCHLFAFFFRFGFIQ